MNNSLVIGLIVFAFILTGTNVLVAPTFSRGHATNFRQSLEEGRRFLLVVKPSHHFRPNVLRGCSFLSSFFSLSRSAQRSSILLSMRSSSASAEVR
jgi:hypothetical protein